MTEIGKSLIVARKACLLRFHHLKLVAGVSSQCVCVCGGVLSFARILTLLCKLSLSLAAVASKQCQGIAFPLRIGYNRKRERSDLKGKEGSLQNLVLEYY